MDDMKRNFASNGQEDESNQDMFHQRQGFQGGCGQSEGFQNAWGHWPYGSFSGGMRGAAQEHRNMDEGASDDWSKTWEMPHSPFPADSLTGLLLQSNSALFAYLYTSNEVENVVFAGLTDQEKATLKEILKKLVASWSEQDQSKI